eukprot:SAG22_NODE_104_length_20159_cov_5.877517_15_plen_57_part_00
MAVYVSVCQAHALYRRAIMYVFGLFSTEHGNEPLRGRECLDEPLSPEMQYVHTISK